MSLLSSYNKYISELVISINLKGNINTKIERFNPRMIYKSSREDKILFIPNIPISLSTLIKANVGFDEYSFKISNFIDVFTNPIKLIKIVKMYKDKLIQKEPKSGDTTKKDKSSSTEAEDEKNDIIKRNINFILSIYFNDDNTLTYYNKPYLIHSYEWNENMKIVPYKKSIPLTKYYINITLYVAENDEEKQKIACDINHINIIQDFNRLGFNFDVPILDTYKYNKPIRNPSIFRPYPGSYQRQFTKYNRYNQPVRYPFNSYRFYQQNPSFYRPYQQQFTKYNQYNQPVRYRKQFKPVYRLTKGGKSGKRTIKNRIDRQKTLKKYKR